MESNDYPFSGHPWLLRGSLHGHYSIDTVNTHCLLPYCGYNCSVWKGVIQSLKYRANTLCQSKQGSEVELENVRKDFVYCLPCLLSGVCYSHEAWKQSGAKRQWEAFAYISIAYVRGVSQKFRRICGQYIFG